MSKLKLAAATTSSECFGYLTEVFAKNDGFVLLPRCQNLEELQSTLLHRPPHVVIVDQAMTRSSDFEVVKACLEKDDVRWTVWDGLPSSIAEAQSAISEIEQGGGLFSLDQTVSPRSIQSHIKSIAQPVKVAVDPLPRSDHPLQTSGHRSNKIILIGSSTGGVDALTRVLSCFPEDCPPTVIVQHTGQKFSQSLSRLLDSRCRPNVHLCGRPAAVERGNIYLAAGTAGHAAFSDTSGQKIEVRNGTERNGHMPSVDVLFESAAPFAKRVVAAILTGMGNDGAQGLKVLRDAGARTLSQDQRTSTVYGMPKVAWETGGSEEQLPLLEIGPKLLNMVSEN